MLIRMGMEMSDIKTGAIFQLLAGEGSSDQDRYEKIEKF